MLDPIKSINLTMSYLVKEASNRQTTKERRLEIRGELTQLRREKRKLAT
jgi:hypothetical protein